jgi:SAM-dependent methyltransferase
MTSDRIEILPVSLLVSHSPLVEEMRRTCAQLGLPLGWHYLLDLSWSADALQPTAGQHVMDAGAGVGPMQWWLAARGVNVVSVDRAGRATLSRRFRGWCKVEGLRPGDLAPAGRFSLGSPLSRNLRSWPGQVWGALARMRVPPEPPPGRGKVVIYHQDLASLSEIPDASLDAVVSISALEHNEPESLRHVVKELMRVIKPDGKLVATLAAAREKDWFHEPSKGWCYSEASLRDMFNLPGNCPSNYGRHDELLAALRDCSELRDNLARLYFKSGDNGMPWGVWDPKYQPVGVVKVKAHE